MSSKPDELDRLAVQPFQGEITPERLSNLLASLAACLQPPVGAGATVADSHTGESAHLPSYCPLNKCGDLHNAPCRRLYRGHGLPAATEEQPDLRRLIDLFVHCRALREFADLAASWTHTSHVAAIIVTPSARVVDCDYRGESFLKAANVLRMLGGQLCCTEVSNQPNFNSALKKAADTGRTMNILLHDPENMDKRFSLTLTRLELRSALANGDESTKARNVLCLVAPLDGRRIATARQLMDLFGLSRAEARLARALCHGDSVKEYARDQGLLLPTVRTQLSSILHKTGTERQATLVRLVAGIPVVRDSA